MRAHHCADIERPKHRAYESCVIANLFLGRCLTFFRVEFLIFWIQKMSHVQNRIRAIMSVTPSEFIWRITKFFAFSGTVPVNANITLWNAGCDAVNRRAKSCTNIFFTQILGHFESPLRQPFQQNLPHSRFSHEKQTAFSYLRVYPPPSPLSMWNLHPIAAGLPLAAFFVVLPAHFLSMILLQFVCALNFLGKTHNFQGQGL